MDEFERIDLEATARSMGMRFGQGDFNDWGLIIMVIQRMHQRITQLEESEVTHRQA